MAMSGTATESAPRRAAAARAARSVKSWARSEATPKAVARAQIWARSSGAAVMAGKAAVAARRRAGCGQGTSRGRDVAVKARRSVRAAGGASSWFAPSSRARMAMAVESCAAAMRAAVPGERRSAMARMRTPPAACVSRPAVRMGRPAASVAARSRPPRRRSSVMFRGIFLKAVPGGKRAAVRARNSSRSGPDQERMRSPPRPAGSIAKSDAARTGSQNSGAGGDESQAGSNGLMEQTRPPRCGRRGCQPGCHPAGRGGGGGGVRGR